jgi:hypothetical protein
VPLLYEIANDGDLPAEARGEDHRMAHRLRARQPLIVPGLPDPPPYWPPQTGLEITVCHFPGSVPPPHAKMTGTAMRRVHPEMEITETVVLPSLVTNAFELSGEKATSFGLGPTGMLAMI